MAKEIGKLNVVVGLDSTGFQNGIGSLNREMRKVQSEFKLASAEMGKHGKELDGLRLKSDSLTKQTELQRQKVKALEEAHQKSVETKGKDAKATQDLEIKLKKVNQEIELQSSGWYKLGKALEPVGQKMQDVEKKIESIGKDLTKKITLPLVGLGTAAVKVGSDFEAGMSEVGAISGATGNDLKKLEEKAKEMGATTKFSASESAESLKYMAMAGWDTTQMLDGLDGVMMLAASSGEDLGLVSDIVTDELDMKISIKPGYAWIEGYLYKIAGEDLILEHGIADPSLNRIDRVVIRLDKTLENRYVKAFILEDTPESTPKAPSLTRNDNVYEISLAQVEIIAGKSFIESYQITDERLETEVCGITTHLFEQVDTTDIFNEWQKYLIHKRSESDLSYEEFVAAYQNIWNSWIVNKISEPSGEFYAEWKSWFNEVQDTTNLVTKSLFDEHKTKVTTEFEQGHMSIEDKQKLDKIEENANNYIHPTTAGNLHIPVGGLVGQILKNIGNGKAGWADNIKAVYGTYTGNNGFNRVIALGFKPKFIFITNIKIDNSTTLFISVSVDKGGFMMNSSGSSFFYNNNTFVPVAVDNGFSISGNSGGRLNYNINRYEYFAIG